MKESRISNVLKNSSANLIYKGVHIILQFVLRTAFIVILGKEYAGITTLFTDILQVLSLMELGIGTAMLYALYEPIANGDRVRINALMNFYKKAYCTIGLLILFVGISVVPFLNYLVTDVPGITENIKIIYIIYVVTTASSYFLIYKSAILRANQKSRVISFIDTIVYTIEALLEVILLLIFKRFYAYLFTHFIFSIIRNVILSYYTERRYRSYICDKTAELLPQETKSLFKDVAALAVYKISGKVIYSTDSIVISAFIGTQEVAVIGNYNLIINSLRTAIELVVDSAKASIGNLAVTSTKEKQEAVFRQMNFIAFWIACFFCTCLFVLLNSFIGDIWLDRTYTFRNNIVIVLVINFFIAVMVYPVEAFRTANGLFVYGKYRPAIMTILNIFLDIVFVHIWGILGVLLATAISRLLTQVWYDPYLIYNRVFRKTPWEYYKEYFIYVILTVITCTATGWLTNIVVICNAYIYFIYKMLIAIIVPNLLLIMVYHKTSEFQSLCNIGRRLIYKLKK